MTEEIRYITNLQRQEEFDNEVTELKDELKRLEQENKELKKQHYETLKMLKHEYNGRQRDNEQWFTRCTENHNEDNKIIEKYRSALEEIREDMEQDTTCESRECSCDDYAECLNCIKETILNKINEVLK